MLTADAIRHLSDEHLVASVHAAADPLTSTPLEQELLARFEKSLDARFKQEPISTVLTDTGFDDPDKADDLRSVLTLANEFEELDPRALLETITEAGIDSAAELKARLDLADKFEAIANDAGDVFARLSALTQE